MEEFGAVKAEMSRIMRPKVDPVPKIEDTESRFVDAAELL